MGRCSWAVEACKRHIWGAVSCVEHRGEVQVLSGCQEWGALRRCTEDEVVAFQDLADTVEVPNKSNIDSQLTCHFTHYLGLISRHRISTVAIDIEDL